VNESAQPKLAEIVRQHESDLLSSWISLQLAEAPSGRRGVDERQLREDSREFLSAFRSALERSSGPSIVGPEWSEVRNLLDRFTQVRVNQGFTPGEVATFVFSIKQPLFATVRTVFANDAAALANATWQTTAAVDKLGLYITEVYQRGRDQVIQRQQEEMLELSTPVVQLWHGILALPLIGTLDSARTQIVMQNLLEAIVRDTAEIAIIDITGVPTVDTLVAQHLLKTVAAARLMGADCIISGIRPQIAQTIIHLGVDLTNVTTKATLADAFATALRRTGMKIVSAERKAGSEGV
jgi:rsbT co-antagonist protein RsbR